MERKLEKVDKKDRDQVELARGTGEKNPALFPSLRASDILSSDPNPFLIKKFLALRMPIMQLSEMSQSGR